MEPAEVVLRFLASVGNAGEAEFYLQLFRAEARERFAVIHVDANVARQAADAVALEIGFLASLGLTPAVAFGLLHAGEAAEHASSLRRRLELAGVPARVVPGEAMAETARAGVLPLAALPEHAPAEDRLERLGALVSSLASRKIVFLTRAGGFRVKGQLLPLVNLSTEAEALAAGRDLSRKEQALLGAARRLALELAPHRLTISVTSPLDLLRELFTVKGAGTLLRRGAVILRRRGLAEVDRDRLTALLAKSFGRPPAATFHAQDIRDVYVEEGYRGAAVIAATSLCPYLTKFAVEREAQGEGLGRDLWQRLVEDHPRFFWRARPRNPINAWYAKVCDGMIRLPAWHVFWRGVPPGDVPALVTHALAAPSDFAA
jgi:hypothetical protein